MRVCFFTMKTSWLNFTRELSPLNSKELVSLNTCNTLDDVCTVRGIYSDWQCNCHLDNHKKWIIHHHLMILHFVLNKYYRSDLYFPVCYVFNCVSLTINRQQSHITKATANNSSCCLITRDNKVKFFFVLHMHLLHRAGNFGQPRKNLSCCLGCYFLIKKLIWINRELWAS